MDGMDYKKNLINYLKKNLSKGYTSEALKWALIRQGYPRAIVENAIEQANKEMSAEVPVFKEKPVIKYEVIGENNKPIEIKKPFWKRIFGL